MNSGAEPRGLGVIKPTSAVGTLLSNVWLVVSGVNGGSTQGRVGAINGSAESVARKIGSDTEITVSVEDGIGSDEERIGSEEMVGTSSGSN